MGKALLAVEKNTAYFSSSFRTDQRIKTVPGVTLEADNNGRNP
jgi:hypothetical protein